MKTAIDVVLMTLLFGPGLLVLIGVTVQAIGDFRKRHSS